MVRFNPDKQAGFTLIEVLVALAVLAIALTAIIKTTAQNIRDTQYLQDKSSAHWVGLRVMNEALADEIKLTAQTETVSEDTTLLGKTWTWEATLKTTPNPHISEIDVTVFRASDHAKLANLVSFRYVQPTA